MGMSDQCRARLLFPGKKIPVPPVQEAGWAPEAGLVGGKGNKVRCLVRIRTPKISTLTVSLYHLR